MKVIIAGGRDFDDYTLLKKVCNHMLKNIDPDELICGTYSHEKNKKWVVDIDIKNEDIVFNVMNFIRYIHNKYKQTTYWLKSFETINGYHVITSPFNLSDWNKDAGLNFPTEYVDATHKDASVLIYANLK